MSRGMRRLSAGKGLVLALIGVAVVGAGGFAAYKLFFERPGEAAVALIPADADMVLTIDTKPSERQATTFKKIADGLEREGLMKELDNLLSTELDKSPIASDLRPVVSTSMAMAIWTGSDPQNPEIAMLVALKDADGAREVLKKYGTPKGSAYFVDRGRGQTGYAGLVGPYLVLAANPAVIERIRATHEGKTPNITSLSAYNDARNSLPRDANLMFFMGGRSYSRMMASATPEGQPAPQLAGIEWIAYSATVGPDGIAFDYHSPVDGKAFPAAVALKGVQSLEMERLGRLPANSYGFLAMSQVGRYWAAVEETFRENRQTLAEVERGVAELERETGLALKRDVLPALNGDLSLSIYPGDSGKPEDLDLLVSLSDSHGSDPAELARKVRAFVERKSSESGSPVSFLEEKVGDATIWRLDSRSQQELTEGFVMPSQDPDSPDNPYASKNLFMAQQGRAMWLASSRGLLTRALSGSDRLESKPAFASFATQDGEAPQSLLYLDLHRVMQAVRTYAEPQSKDVAVNWEDVELLFGDGSRALTVSGTYDGRVGRGRMMLPLDWDRGIRVLGQIYRESKKSSVRNTN